MHKVNDVERLYMDSKDLYDKVIKDEADQMLDNLSNAINILKDNWKGIDAGAQINGVVYVYNSIIKVRNYLSILARDSSVVASNYRRIQKISCRSLDSLSRIKVDFKNSIEDYSDNRDTIDIEPAAINGKKLINISYDEFEEFKKNVYLYYNRIMDNWVAGPGRDNAEMAFNEFMDNAERNRQILADVAFSIDTSLSNYNLYEG